MLVICYLEYNILASQYYTCNTHIVVQDSTDSLSGNLASNDLWANIPVFLLLLAHHQFKQNMSANQRFCFKMFKIYKVNLYISQSTCNASTTLFVIFSQHDQNYKDSKVCIGFPFIRWTSHIINELENKSILDGIFFCFKTFSQFSFILINFRS